MPSCLGLQIKRYIRIWKNNIHWTTSLLVWCLSDQKASAFPVKLVSENPKVSSQTNQNAIIRSYGCPLALWLTRFRLFPEWHYCIKLYVFVLRMIYLSFDVTSSNETLNLWNIWKPLLCLWLWFAYFPWCWFLSSLLFYSVAKIFLSVWFCPQPLFYMTEDFLFFIASNCVVHWDSLRRALSLITFILYYVSCSLLHINGLYMSGFVTQSN